MRAITGALLAAMLLATGPARGLDRFVATTGADVGNCSLPGAACLTLAYAIAQANAGDAVRIAAGTYPAGLVTIDKALTLFGAQAGVDARTRSGPESTLSNSLGLSVAASDVVLDGLTIRGSSNAAFTGYGLWLNPGYHGARILNTIFEDNIVGLGLANSGPTAVVVQFNLFRGNNLPGPQSGTGIYSDEFASGTVTDVLISDNAFVDNANAAIAFASTDPTRSASAIGIRDNLVDGGGRGFYFFQVQGATVADNTITNVTAPGDGGSSVGIALFGPGRDVAILRNKLHAGVAHGIRIAAGNADVSIHDNDLSAFALAALRVDGAPTGPAGYATCNWWGNASGPAHPQLNPGGSGDSVVGDLARSDFAPWRLAPLPDADACATSELFADGFETPP